MSDAAAEALGFDRGPCNCPPLLEMRAALADRNGLAVVGPMTDRQRRAYRVVVTEAPDGGVPMLVENDDDRVPYDEKVRVPRPTWRDPNAVRTYIHIDYVVGHNPDPEAEEPSRWFTVGQSRAFLSRRGAERKADLWVAHGCKVRIDVSEPIVWTEGEAS